MYVLRVCAIFVVFIAAKVMVVSAAVNTSPSLPTISTYGTNCGDTHTGTYGEISSPLYPENYPGNTTCIWKITVPEESRVSVKFRSFDLYCPHDYLEIYLDGTDDEVHDDRLCGSNYYTLLSEANSIFLMFVSDSNLSGKGFHLIWRAVELVSRGKPTKQSSVLVVAGDPRGSDLAVDGDPNPFFNSGSCTHTYDDFEPWWTVDLEKAYAVQFVDIVNRESAAERLANAVVHIGMNPTPHSVNPRCGSTVSAESILLSTNIRVDCNELMYGRYVSVYVVGRNEYLTLCEVEVFGINLISSHETTVDCSYSPGPCDIPATDCSIPSFEWPSCMCDDSMFQCNNGRCIPMTYRCNLYDNCGDASDEYSCECSSVNDTLCVDSGGSYCVAARFVCDGFDNCPDYSDEIAGCPCGENEYQCSDDGRCLPSTQVCDHILDCKDGQDEANCVTCGDATVVQISRHCDGNYDCSDERDERNCETPGCHVIIYGSDVECNLADATFSTFNYPFDYSPGSRCTWYIESPSSSSFIRLTFLDFDIPSDALCQSDTIIVYDGEVESDDIIGEFCNYNRPPEYVVSSRTKMTLVFYSDSTVSGRGFQASYTSESVVSDGADFNSNKCSPEWIFYENACYRNFSNLQDITWTDAKWECEQMNAHLVFVSTELEMEFIHYMLTHFWNSEHTEVYIGLSDRLSSNGLLSWSNGSPMSYTAWYRPMQDGKENVAKNQPKAGDLEQCTLIRLDNFHSLQQWNEVACEFPTTSQYICKYQLDMYLNVTTTVEQVEKSFKGCYREDYQCDNQECIHQLFVCDGKTDCRDGSDEFNCENECEYGDFQCKDKQCIPVSFVCDFITQCTDMSDEIECHYPNCTSEEFTCDNGQCVDSNQRCDLLIQCTDGSDEKDCDFCSSGFQCYDGSCLPLRAVCDATNDCPGDTVEDEMICDYWINATCPADTMACKNKECSPKRFRCLYDLDEYHIQKGCRDMSHLERCDDYNCLEDTFKCPSSYCIAERLRCNAIWDCPNGEDERECDSYVCPNSYKCRNSIICIAHNDRCNGVKNCPEGDDEIVCDDVCPAPECSCRGLEVTCHGIAWNQTLASIILPSARYLNLTNLRRNSVNRRSTRGVTLKDSLLLDIDQFSLLIAADFSSNGIEEILPNTFGQQVNLQILVLSNNEIKHLEKGAFNGLRNLQFLYIDYNGLISVDSGVFSVLSALQNLYLQENMLTEFQEDVFDGLHELKSLSTDDFLFCCMINDIVGDIEHCHPPADQFSSCEDLMKNVFLRVLMWILGVSALLGNVIVIVWRLYSKDYRNVQSILITNLAASDFLMGLYMIIIAGADLYYRGRYARVAEDWKSSFLCNFAGAISTLSSEFSVFILVVMSLDRAVSVGFPFSTARLNRKKCLIMLAIAWLTMIVISFLPMFNIPYFGESYYGRPSVCLALPLTGDRLDGWEYSVAIFLGFNLLGFVIIAISYTYIYVVVKQAGASVNKSQSKTKELKMATKMAIIVFTDFCCWFPIILMGIVSQAGAWQIPVDIYVWSATLIMPINSSLNPYLYTIPYIKDARKRKKLSKKGTCASIMMSETQKAEVTLLDKVKQDLERNRVLPLLSIATSRPYLLSSILATHTKKVTENLTSGPLFTNEEITQIETDLTKALQFLHRSKLTHGTISEEHVIIQTDKAHKRAFLIVASTATTNTTEGVSPEQDFEQLNNLLDKLRRSKIN